MKTYHLYGRKSYQDSLAFVAKIEKPEDFDFKGQTLEATNKAEWLELISIPEEAIEHVVLEGKIV